MLLRGAVPEIRSALRKDGPVITDLGNMVVDVRSAACSLYLVVLYAFSLTNELIFPLIHRV